MHVRYLGVPLLSTKLKHSDCKSAIDRITARTKNWANRDLTYAGRVQLIKNVLFSMQTTGHPSLYFLKKSSKRLRPYSGPFSGLALSSKNLELRCHGNTCAPPNRREDLALNPSKYGIKLLWPNISGSSSLVGSNLCGANGSNHTY